MSQVIQKIMMERESLWQSAYRHFSPLIKQAGVEYGAEIGVGLGGHAEYILRNTGVKILYGVDPYKVYTGSTDDMQIDQRGYNELYGYTLRRMIHHGTRYQHIREFSFRACNLIPHPLGFVFLDHTISLAMLENDLRVWHRKIQNGGLIGGRFYGLYGTVTDAVNHFVTEKNLRLNEEEDFVWWARV